MVTKLSELDDYLGFLDHEAPFPTAGEGPRGRQGSAGKVTLHTAHWRTRTTQPSRRAPT